MKYQAFNVDGVANDTVYDGGLYSTAEQPIKIQAIIVSVDNYQGNIVEGWIGNERILEIPDYNFDTYDVAAADTPYPSTTKIIRLPIDENIPAGERFRVAVRCGAATTDLDGTYEYVISST